jgi:hypothetical protein
LTVLPLGVAVALSWVAVGTSAFWVLLLVNSVVAYPVFIGVVLAYDWLRTWLATTYKNEPRPQRYQEYPWTSIP